MKHASPRRQGGTTTDPFTTTSKGWLGGAIGREFIGENLDPLWGSGLTSGRAELRRLIDRQYAKFRFLVAVERAYAMAFVTLLGTAIAIVFGTNLAIALLLRGIFAVAGLIAGWHLGTFLENRALWYIPYLRDYIKTTVLQYDIWRAVVDGSDRTDVISTPMQDDKVFRERLVKLFNDYPNMCSAVSIPAFPQDYSIVVTQQYRGFSASLQHAWKVALAEALEEEFFGTCGEA